MRQEGYYWVKYEGAWHVAHFRHTSNPLPWTLLINNSWFLHDSDFEEINENRLTHE